MQILKNFQLQSNFNKPILVDLFFEKNQQKKPLIIFIHGYKGYKDWGVFGKMHSEFISKGFALLTFNFSHNGGIPEQPIDFPDLEAFGNNNYTKELNDTQTVIDWVHHYDDFKTEIDYQNITLIGHSRGGGIATLTAAKDSRISQLITWAAVSTLDRSFFHGEQLEQWKKDLVIFVENGRTKQQMPHYIQFYQDYIDNESDLHIETATKKIKIPHLVIHGDGDLAVPFFHAENYCKWNPKSELANISNANHVFGAKQPWTEESFPKDFELVLEKSLNFLKQ